MVSKPCIVGNSEVRGGRNGRPSEPEFTKQKACNIVTDLSRNVGRSFRWLCLSKTSKCLSGRDLYFVL